MPSISPSHYPTIKKLYSSGTIMAKIAEHFGVPIDAVVYAMRKGKIPRRSAQQARALRFEQQKPSFQIKKMKNESDRTIENIGLALYWAEGSKSPNARVVDFANSDPVMIAMFMRFLKNCYNLDFSKLRALLYCYANQDNESLIRFWSKITNIPVSQFSKPYIRHDYRENGRKMEHGLIHIRYADKKLLSAILGRIEELKKSLK
jgi:hypothetical protein